MNIKHFLIAGFLTLLVTPMTMGAYEYTWNITASNVVDRHNNFLVKRDGETWLIHHKTGCGEVREGDRLTLIIRGELDGSQDLLRKSLDRVCIVDLAELVTHTLTVSKVSTSDTGTHVLDASGQEYRIYYSERCGALKGQNGNPVHVRQDGTVLKEGDTIFVPGSLERCPLTTVQAILPYPEEPEIDPRTDIKHPTTPTRVRAIPTKDAVYIYWDPSTDASGISHYIVNASLYHTEDAKVREPGDLIRLENEIKTPDSKPSLRLTSLEPDELYFFRVVAVDKAGNLSPYWSREATAMTKSSIAQIDVGPVPLRIFPAQEDDFAFLFRWNNIPSSNRYTVILEVDGEREVLSTNWNHIYYRISKTNAREGKPLKLIVRTLDYRGTNLEDTVTFSF